MARRRIVLRPATIEDAALLLDWANDPEVRAASLTTDRIELGPHTRWLSDRLADRRAAIWIGLEPDDGRPVGVVRFEVGTDRVATVSITVAPAERGRRWGSELLGAGLERARQELAPGAFRAIVRPGNRPSEALFAAAGFVPVPASAPDRLEFLLPVAPEPTPPTRDRGGGRAAWLWLAVVAAVYVGATLAMASGSEPRVDRAMAMAVNILHGHLDMGLPPGANDTAAVNGLTYQVVSPLPVVPYLVFAPFPVAWEAARWIISTVAGIAAAWLALPLARRYGPGGRATWWLAALGAFGTLLFSQAVNGNFYYLAHVEAILFTFVALIEWGGRRRPWVVGLGLGLAGLARPTVLVAAIPFAIAVIASRPDRRRAAIGFITPIAAAIGLTGLYNAARFGSPLESGYGLSALTYEALAARRGIGLFSLRHLPDNLALFLARGFDIRSAFPYLVPDDNGHSILLTSPALVAAVTAGIRKRSAQLLWLAAFLVAVPVLLYYGGGGFRTYGYRYALDFMPFLLALVAIGARTRFGALEKLLVGISVAFVSYGIVWAVFR